MSKLLDSFWRAVAYCLHPRVIALSVLPLVIMVVLSLALGYFFWDEALVAVRASLESWELLGTMARWLEGLGLGNLRVVLAPTILLFLSIPVIVIVALLFVAILMTPAMVALVAERRFPGMERKKGGSVLASLAWSLGSTVLAAVALVISIPLWLIPPLILILPPLIWGWLTYRVMAFDALGTHASPDERRLVFREHRPWLLGIGVLAGFLGAAPSVVWASGVLLSAVFFVFLLPIAIWIYTLIFAFASLWFAHYCLSALERTRADAAPAALAPVPPIPTPAPLGLPDETNSPIA